MGVILSQILVILKVSWSVELFCSTLSRGACNGVAKASGTSGDKGGRARGDLSPLFNLIYMQTLERFLSLKLDMKAGVKSV